MFTLAEIKMRLLPGYALHLPRAYITPRPCIDEKLLCIPEQPRDRVEIRI